MDYSNLFRFKGTWRNYQERVLNNYNRYIKDGRIHIVAAPGSGKTTLGIELIVRLGMPALIFAPSITIREQWVARIAQAFLIEGKNADDYLSQSLKDLKTITVVTYQSLHSAMTKYIGTEDESEEDSSQCISENVDYSSFDLIAAVKNAGIGVICLDECHHLRSEWWKALENFKEKAGALKVIALTATPPYDSTPAMWNRYMNMCGEIDEEITIPELVKEGSLCAHQDYVYMNYPTKEEMEQIDVFEQKSRQMFEKLMVDEAFSGYVKTHRELKELTYTSKLADDTQYLQALLIFAKEKNMSVPSVYVRAMKSQTLAKMEPKHMQVILQNFLYDDADSYEYPKEYGERLTDELKSSGLIDKKKVMLTADDSIEKLLTNSKGKCTSIKNIVDKEYENLSGNLRMLVLTDYIRKEYEKNLGDENADVTALGVLPFFEQLRRSNADKKDRKFGILCGTIVIIPATAKESLLEAVKDTGKVSFSKAGSLSEDEYIKVNAIGDSHFLTAAVTKIFTDGHMQVLIGTKSLLGEGWDSPCINSLILASFVGSFMLSNQMRGRAIRVFSNNLNKTSNIWHLVCVNPYKSNEENASEDYTLLKRRMEHFLGLAYSRDVIENGTDRLDAVTEPFTLENVNKTNEKMLSLSGKREEVRSRWASILGSFKSMEVVDESQVADILVSDCVYKKAKSGMIVWAVYLAVMLVAVILGVFSFAPVIGVIAIAFGLIKMIFKLPKVIALGTADKRLYACATSIVCVLNKNKMFDEKVSGGNVHVYEVESGIHSVYLKGGSNRDKALFAKCVGEFFGMASSPRYLLVRGGNYRKADGIYCIPEIFGKKKEDAAQFAQEVIPFVGEMELSYTKNDEGKRFLLESSVEKLCETRKRCISKKRIIEA